MTRNLTNNTLLKYQRLIDEWFVNGFNGTKAYKKFYPKVKKNETATANFSKIQALPEVKEYIEAKHEEAAKKVEITHEGILNELKAWLEFDKRETMLMTVEQFKSLPSFVGRFIKKYELKRRAGKSLGLGSGWVMVVENIEFVAPEKVLEMINKHIGFYEQDNKQKAPQINYESLGSDILLKIWDARNTN